MKLGLLFLAQAALLVACAAAAPSPKVQSCALRYQACVASSPDMTAYVLCRSQVDRDCLDGGAP